MSEGPDRLWLIVEMALVAEELGIDSPLTHQQASQQHATFDEAHTWVLGIDSLRQIR